MGYTDKDSYSWCFIVLESYHKNTHPVCIKDFNLIVS